MRKVHVLLYLCICKKCDCSPGLGDFKEEAVVPTNRQAHLCVKTRGLQNKGLAGMGLAFLA